MDMLKKFFPLSFKEKKDVAALVINLIIHLVVAIIGGAVIALAGMLTGWIPVLGAIIGWALGIVGTLVSAYCLVGGVLSVLDYLKVLK